MMTDGTPPINESQLRRYLDRSGSAEERRVVEAWLRSEPVAGGLVQGLRGIATRDEDVETVWERIVRETRGAALAHDVRTEQMTDRHAEQIGRTLRHWLAGVGTIGLFGLGIMMLVSHRDASGRPGVTRQVGLAVGPDSVQGNTGADYAAHADATCLPFMRSVGQAVASLPPDDWFRPGDTVVKRTLGYPVPGHVTLVLSAPLGTGRPTPQLEAARRLYHRYAKEGLDIVVVHQRTGFVWGSAPLPPSEETELIRWYDHDYLKLPFPIAIYDANAAPSSVLVGRDGRRYASGTVSESNDEIALDAFIRQALADRRGSTP